jgi:hypothetical protein
MVKRAPLFPQPIGIHNGKYEWASRPSTGDCSLKVMNVDIKFDDGEWACQVDFSLSLFSHYV